MLATIFMSMPCARAKMIARPGAVPASSSPARKAWKRSGFAWKRICFSSYFFPWFGVRSLRTLISHTCSSAAKPRPRRMVGTCCANAPFRKTPHSAATMKRIIDPPELDVIRVELFPVYQPVSRQHEQLVQRIADQRDEHDHGEH